MAATVADTRVELTGLDYHALNAMLTDVPFLWHSLLSPYINCGLLDPLDLCRGVEASYRAGHTPLNAAEGFIRQIIG